MTDPYASIAAELAALDDKGLRRRMRAIDGSQGAVVHVDGREVVNFSSNNYLGLADDAELAAAAAAATATHGFGAGASRLIVGNLAPHRALEADVARWLGTEAALVFGSGYQANVGAIGALVGPGDAIFSDALNHASIIDGARLSRAQVHVFPHRDVDALGRMLATADGYRRRLIVSDTVFSMDGETAPVAELVALGRRHGALVYVDEAHAGGVLGPRGAGVSAGLAVDVRMGTFGKALGGAGAFVAGTRDLVELVVQRARGFVFSTAPPVPIVAWARAAIARIVGPDGEARRAHLDRLARHFHAGLVGLGLDGGRPPSHIVPVRVGAPEAAMAVTEALLERGIYAQAVRPPTVPPGTSRLRMALSAGHSESHLDAALAALAAVRDRIPTP